MPGVQGGAFRGPPGHDPGPSNGYLARQAPNFNGGGYYYSRETSSASGTPKMNAAHPRNGVVHGRRPPSRGTTEEESPSYWVEHLATFAVGKQYGLERPSDGIRKLKQMERNSAIWAQPMILRLRPSTVAVEDENGEVVEQFPMSLVADPTSHLSTDPKDVYNNIVLFVVQEDRRQPRSATPTEMHIFQCNRVSAMDVQADLKAYLSGHFARVKPGRRDTGFVPGSEIPNGAPTQFLSSSSYHQSNQPVINSYTRTESREMRNNNNNNGYSNGGVESGRVNPVAIRDDASASSDSSEYFERDVNTLNRCFDDIERFVARIQSAALAQRELEAARRRRSRRDPGILSLRSQLPGELEFVDVLQKFKLSFNLLAKLKNHIHEPNAPELLHFLFTPLTVILDASQWGLGRNIASQVLSPLLTREASDLLRNCLTSKEHDVWMALGDAWRIPPEEWQGNLPPPYRPVFADGYMPYGPPGGAALPPPPIVDEPAPPSVAVLPNQRQRHRSVEDLEMDRISLEKDRLEFEKDKLEEDRRRILDRERKVLEEERKLREEKERVADEKRALIEEQERRSVISERPIPSYIGGRDYRDSGQSSPAVPRSVPLSVLGGSAESPRQRVFLEELTAQHAKIVQVNYDRVGQNAKELTVSKGEYLEVLNDTKKWWECRNVHSRVGYVPHTILLVVSEGAGARGVQQPLFVSPGPSTSGPSSANYVREDGVFSGPGSPTHRPVEFVDVVNAGVQASLPVIRTTAPAPPPPGPPPDLRSVPPPRAPSVPESGRKPQIQAIRRDVSQNDMLREELERTVGRGKSREELLRKGKSGDGQVLLDEESSGALVFRWLQAKGFSVRTLQLLEGQTGATLFALNKRQLQDFCGKEEGQRLYSQLLVQKNMTGFTTKSGAELKAILNLRKEAAERERNGHPESEPRLTQLFTQSQT